MRSAPKSIDDYLASVPEPHKKMLQDLRRKIKKLVPEAEETISYQIPTFKLNGRILVSFAAFKNHCSLFPVTGAADRSKEFEMKRVMVVLASLGSLAIVIYGQTSPCTGGVFGGRRNIAECRAPVLDKCDPFGHWNWVWEGSCDVWCCPGVYIYLVNNCQNPFTRTNECCPTPGQMWINSPLAPTCTLDSPPE